MGVDFDKVLNYLKDILVFEALTDPFGSLSFPLGVLPTQPMKYLL